MNFLSVLSRRSRGLTSLLALTLFWVGCGSTGSPPAVGSGTAGVTGEMSSSGGASQGVALGAAELGGDEGRSEADVLRVGDPITITFTGVSDPPPKFDERIKADGMISLPLLKQPLKAAGKSRGELEEEIHRLYVPNLYIRLTVKVNSEGRYFHVRGEVRAPGRYQYLGEMTILKALASAGDFTDFANRRGVTINRIGKKIAVDCEKAQKNPQHDVAIYPDDLIIVPRRFF